MSATYFVSISNCCEVVSVFPLIHNDGQSNLVARGLDTTIMTLQIESKTTMQTASLKYSAGFSAYFVAFKR